MSSGIPNISEYIFNLFLKLGGGDIAYFLSKKNLLPSPHPVADPRSKADPPLKAVVVEAAVVTALD